MQSYQGHHRPVAPSQANRLVVSCIVRPSARSNIHLSSCNASRTERFFLMEILNRFGATVFGQRPCNHWSCQKLASLPSFTVIDVAMENSTLSESSQGKSRPTQGLSGCFEDIQSHRRRSARPNLCRSKTPRPPRCFDRASSDQLALHFPPLHDVSPFHNHAVQSLTTRFRIHTGSLCIVIK